MSPEHPTLWPYLRVPRREAQMVDGFPPIPPGPCSNTDHPEGSSPTSIGVLDMYSCRDHSEPLGKTDTRNPTLVDFWKHTVH